MIIHIQRKFKGDRSQIYDIGYFYGMEFVLRGRMGNGLSLFMLHLSVMHEFLSTLFQSFSTSL